jgi:hypothetical protein
MKPLLAAALLVLAGCGGTAPPAGSPTTGGPTGTPGASATAPRPSSTTPAATGTPASGTPSPTQPPNATPTQPGPETLPPGGDQLPMTVVDFGVSTVDGPAYYAVIVQNPNTAWVALGVGVTTTFLDSGGKEIPSSASGDLIPTLRPGEKNAIANMSPAGSRAASISVDVIVSDWLPAGVVPPNQVTVSDISTTTSGDQMTTTCTLKSASGDAVGAMVTVVYRDAGRKIIGGGHEPASLDPQGQAAFEFHALEPLPAASTEVYVSY